MNVRLAKGRYRARLAVGEADLRAAQALRHLCFVERAGLPARPESLDRDAFDPLCRHVLIESHPDGQLVACFRLMWLQSGAEIGQSYSAQYYELDALAGFAGRMAEIGRFCIRPGVQDADVLRVAWGALTRFVDEEGVELLFGCSSFAGTEAERYLDAFAMLTEAHLAPKRWLPRVKAPRVFRFAERLAGRGADRRLALLRMPPLLRSYLVMGGWVSDHAVVDTDLGTLHVFTGVEIGKVPPGRVKSLRAVAG